MEMDTQAEIKTDTWSILVLASLGMVASVGILSNALILATVWTDQRLRNATCWFICSLATADIMVLIFAVPFAAMQDLRGQWPLAEKYCDAWIVFDLTFAMASLLSILLLAVDKYLNIKFPFSYALRMNRRMVFFVLFFTWSFAFVTILPPVSHGHHSNQEGFKLSNSTPYECLPKFTPTYSLLLTLLDFILPCIVMTLIYGKLYRQAKETAAEIKAVRISLECNYVSSPDRPKTGSITRVRSEFKAALTVGLIMGTYLICWLPFFAVQIMHSFNEDCCPSMAYKVGVWMGYVNSAANPLIYGFMDKRIRGAFKMFMWRASLTTAIPRLPGHKDSKDSKDSVSSF